MDIRTGVDLAPYNTFGIAARAARYAELRTEEDVREAIATGERLTVIGGGSNVLPVGDVDGLVVRIALTGLAVEQTTPEAVWVRAAAGESWHALVLWTIEHGWGGLENLSLIPGTVGAAPVQNIGAYGVELDSVCACVEAVDVVTGAKQRFDRAACGFGYRDSIFKRTPGRYLITSVLLRLPRAWHPVLTYRELADELRARGLHDPTPHEISQAVCAIRRRKLPDTRELGNAGSFFKNPVVDARHHAQLKSMHPDLPAHVQPDGSYKLAAGWLIERAGWKGRAAARAGVYEKQALVLVNRGGATGADVLALAAAITADVRARYGVELEREPVLIGAADGAPVL